jgi:hypothetical protein
MKTFQEFILEALLIEDDQQEYAEIRAKIKMLQSRGRPGDAAEAQRLSIQAQELVRNLNFSAQLTNILDKDKPKDKPRENTYISGKPSKSKDTRGRAGSLENIPSSAGEGENTSTGGRFGDRRSGRSGGVSGQSRNNATARNLGHLGSRS